MCKYTFDYTLLSILHMHLWIQMDAPPNTAGLVGSSKLWSIYSMKIVVYQLLTLCNLFLGLFFLSEFNCRSSLGELDYQTRRIVKSWIKHPVRDDTLKKKVIHTHSTSITLLVFNNKAPDGWTSSSVYLEDLCEILYLPSMMWPWSVTNDF